MDITKAVSELVKEECAKESNPYGYLSSWEHINHVVKHAMLFAKEIGADEEIVELAAWLHDFASIQGYYEDHHIRGAATAEEILRNFDYPTGKIKQIKHCIFTHRSSQGIKQETIEAKCVANADAVAHFLEIPDLLCSKYARDTMSIEEVVAWLNRKLERDYKKITLPEAQKFVEPYHKAAEIILKR